MAARGGAAGSSRANEELLLGGRELKRVRRSDVRERRSSAFARRSPSGWCRRRHCRGGAGQGKVVKEQRRGERDWNGPGLGARAGQNSLWSSAGAGADVEPSWTAALASTGARVVKM